MSEQPDPANEPPIRFGPDGLIPAVIQDADTGDVLMVGFMNAEALAATRATGRTHFWSRSRNTLWRKGETSGHEQIVESIAVNCEQNSLLLTVRQLGAVCHEGYATCFYRRLEPDNTLTTVRERVFDPTTVYGTAPEPATDLATASRLLYGAYAYLRGHDLAAASATSARLRAPDDGTLPRRVADELRELAGVLDGTHRHHDPRSDALLEGTQVLYWVLLVALRAGVTWDQLRPDRALATREDSLAPGTAARLLRAAAGRWGTDTAHARDVAARCHATLALAAQACAAAGITPDELLAADLAELRARPYLAPYFARHSSERG